MLKSILQIDFNSLVYTCINKLLPLIGDEIVGATIHFDRLKKNEVIEILNLIEPYNDKVQVLTKSGLRSSKSLGNLDNTIKAPEEVCAGIYFEMYNREMYKYFEMEDQNSIVWHFPCSSTPIQANNIHYQFSGMPHIANAKRNVSITRI